MRCDYWLALMSAMAVPGELRRGCLKGWRIVRKEVRACIGETSSGLALASAAPDERAAVAHGWRQVGLGRGREVYERATRALREWRMHDGSRDTGIFVHPESGAAATLVGREWTV